MIDQSVSVDGWKSLEASAFPPRGPSICVDALLSLVLSSHGSEGKRLESERRLAGECPLRVSPAFPVYADDAHGPSACARALSGTSHTD